MFTHSFKYLILTAVLILSASCGKNKDEEVVDALRSANILLSSKKCQEAIDLLEGIGRQNRNSKYLKSLASAYGCRANYSTITFFGSDIKKTASPGPLGGMTTYSTSIVTPTTDLSDDDKFKDLQTAINILLYAGGIATTTEPYASERAKYFSLNEAGDINSELTFMLMVQAGKFMKIYGNASAAGVKGSADASGNKCFTDYSQVTNNVIEAGIPSLPGSCKMKNSSHPQLDSTVVSSAERKQRLCEGVVLINSIFDVLPSVLATASGGDIEDISSVTNEISKGRKLLSDNIPEIAVLLNTLSQKNCVDNADIDEEMLETFYVGVYETIFQ